MFRKYPNVNLCIYSQLRLYVDRTGAIRNELKQLWLTTTVHTRHATKQTVSNWIKFCLNDVGLVDFAPHSLRAASVSKAMTKQVNFDAILSAGGWSLTSVFTRHYNLPVRKTGISDAIL